MTTCCCGNDNCNLTPARMDRIRREKCSGCRDDFYNWQRKADTYGVAIPDGHHCWSMPDVSLERKGRPTCYHAGR